MLQLRLLRLGRRRRGAVAVVSIDGEVSEDAVVGRPASILRTIVPWRDQSVQIRSRNLVDSVPSCADGVENSHRHRRRLRPGYDSPRYDPACHPG